MKVNTNFFISNDGFCITFDKYKVIKCLMCNSHNKGQEFIIFVSNQIMKFNNLNNIFVNNFNKCILIFFF